MNYLSLQKSNNTKITALRSKVGLILLYISWIFLRKRFIITKLLQKIQSSSPFPKHNRLLYVPL